MKTLFVGGGNMASAMIGGLTARGIAASAIGVIELNAEARQTLQTKYGVATFAAVAEAPIETAEIIVLAVKPQQLRGVANELAGRLGAAQGSGTGSATGSAAGSGSGRAPAAGNALILSIAAGIRLTDLSRWLGGYRKVVRSMPNTPALIQCGVTGLYAPPEVDAAARSAVEQVVAAIGTSFWVDDEALMDSVTAVSGSGPAYVFHFMEALQQGALNFGFSSDSARQMALETVLGAAKLAAASGDGFDVLRQRVTSKGGTTEAALAAMDAARVAEGIIAGMVAAQKRGRELGELLGKEA